MSASKKPKPRQDSEYKAAAETRRKKIAQGAPVAGAVPISAGRLNVVLNGKPIANDRRADVFGNSSIDIPEFSTVRARKPT